MAKNKSAQAEKAIKTSKDSQVKPLPSVKQGAVTETSQTPKSKSKEMGKQVAVKADNVDKKFKKAKKEPTPVSESESDTDGEVEGSASSASSDDDSEVEAPIPRQVAKTNGVKTNDAAKVAPESDDESSESSSSSEDEPTVPKSVPAVAAEAVAGAKVNSESEEDNEDSSEEESDEEAKGPVNAKALNGKLETVASKEVCARTSTWHRQIII